MRLIFLNIIWGFYRLLRPLIFLFDSETVHNFFTSLGEFFGSHKILKLLIRFFLVDNNTSLRQNVVGINFEKPVGLAAGFDYKAKLTQITPSIGFGFETIGTITNSAYEGNPKPRLGRLVKSKSIMVYKGFKNEGIKVIAKKLKKINFEIPIGISIGKTNSKNDKMTQNDAIEDIISAFKIAERENLKISYYELNISCPNLFGGVSFYPPKNLEDLLLKVSKLKIKKPIFVKMPISKSDKEVLEILNTIVKFPIDGVIFGNTQNNRNDKSFVKEEISKYSVGNFSGKPTFDRSNELIKLTYKKYGKKLVVIGTGGIFSAKDAYTKIKLGASLVQLITGLVFEGPQLISQINLELPKLFKKDGFSNIRQAVGASVI